MIHQADRAKGRRDGISFGELRARLRPIREEEGRRLTEGFSKLVVEVVGDDGFLSVQQGEEGKECQPSFRTCFGVQREG
jgi:hypothetical protein